MIEDREGGGAGDLDLRGTALGRGEMRIQIWDAPAAIEDRWYSRTGTRRRDR